MKGLFRETVAVLDVGSNSITASLWAESEGSFKTLSAITIESENITNGYISNYHGAKQDIKKAVQQVEVAAKKRIKKAMIVLSGNTDSLHIFPYSIPINTPLSAKEFFSLLDRNLFQEAVGEDRYIAHLFPMRMKLDGHTISDARNLKGRRLTIDVALLSTDALALQNIQDSIESIGIEVLYAIMKPMATGFLALKHAHTKHSLLINSDRIQTHATFFHKGMPIAMQIVDKGLETIYTHMAHHWQIPIKHAEALYGHIEESHNDLSDYKVFSIKKDDGLLEIGHAEAKKIIRQAWQTLLQHILEKIRDIKEFPYIQEIIIAGNGCAEEIVKPVIQDVFHDVSRIWSLNNKDIQGKRYHPALYTALGCLQYQKAYRKHPLFLYPLNIAHKLLNWLRFW